MRGQAAGAGNAAHGVSGVRARPQGLGGAESLFGTGSTRTYPPCHRLTCAPIKHPPRPPARHPPLSLSLPFSRSEIDAWSGKRKRDLITSLSETNEGLKGYAHVNKKVSAMVGTLRST